MKRILLLICLFSCLLACGGEDSPTQPAPRTNPPVDTTDNDPDGDGIVDSLDNCPNHRNPNQLDTDGDRAGDACDVDDDGDGVFDAIDNCPLMVNPSQLDLNNNGIGDLCEGYTPGFPDISVVRLSQELHCQTGWDPWNLKGLYHIRFALTNNGDADAVNPIITLKWSKGSSVYSQRFSQTLTLPISLCGINFLNKAPNRLPGCGETTIVEFYIEFLAAYVFEIVLVQWLSAEDC